MRTPQFIMIHHSLTEDGETVSWPAIEKYHRETNGWQDIGYHAGVEIVTSNPELDKYKYQGLVGRHETEHAAACPQGNMNELALHICCVGNYDLIEPPTELLKCLYRRFVLPWSVQFNISPERWVGHRDYNPAKSCPGNKFNLDNLRDMYNRDPIA